MPRRLPVPSRKVVAVTNQKGGVGKTTVLLGLVSSARQRNLRTLVVDSDPTGMASFTLGSADNNGTLNDVIYSDAEGVAIEAINDTAWGPLVSCIPATKSLASRNKDLDLSAPYRLLKALQGDQLFDSFDLILVDCPPNLDLLMTGALIAARHYIVVTEPSPFSNRAYGELQDTIDTVIAGYNRYLQPAGFILNKVPFRGKEATHRVSELEAAIDDPNLIWRPYIPNRVDLMKAQGAQQPIHEYISPSKDVCQLFDAYLERLLTVVKEA